MACTPRVSSQNLINISKFRQHCVAPVRRDAAPRPGSASGTGTVAQPEAHTHTYIHTIHTVCIDTNNQPCPAHPESRASARRRTHLAIYRAQGSCLRDVYVTARGRAHARSGANTARTNTLYRFAGPGGRQSLCSTLVHCTRKQSHCKASPATSSEPVALHHAVLLSGTASRSAARGKPRSRLREAGR